MAVNNQPEAHIELTLVLPSRNSHAYTVSASKLNLKQQLVAVTKKIMEDVANDKTFSDVFTAIPQVPEAIPEVPEEEVDYVEPKK